MKLQQPVLIALAALPLVACGAPGGDLSDGSAGEALVSQIVPQPPRVINFDDDGFGSALTDGEDIASVYTLRGVTFACEGTCGDRSVFARAPGASGNGVSVRAKVSAQTVLQPEFDASFGVVRASFVKPASRVGIDAFAMVDSPSISRGPAQGAPWLKAYDLSGNELDEDNYTATFGSFQTLSVVSGAYDIAFVEFSSSTAGANLPERARFDNLTFDQAPLKTQPPLQPAPTSGPALPPRLP